MTDQQNAPDRIWAWKDKDWDATLWNNHGDPRYTPKQAAEYIRADLAQQVKPLVWDVPSTSNNWIHLSDTDFGCYGIHIDGGRHRAWLESSRPPFEIWLGDDDVGSVEAAKAAAQADYERRIRSALAWTEDE